MKITDVCKSFTDEHGDTVKVLDCFSLNAEKNSIVCITGPSGCGKTTLLNIISSLLKADSGSVEFELGEEKVSYLFQEPRLFPWKTVFDNVNLVVTDKLKTMDLLHLVGLEDSADKYPGELSGGERQRVAIARAFGFDCGTVLLDEPFQNLDVARKEQLANVFFRLWQTEKKTVIWVTHDPVELNGKYTQLVRM